MLHQLVGSIATAAAVALMLLLIFATYTAAMTHNDFLWAGQPQNCPFTLGPPESATQTSW